jgi:hypothetical protein
MNNASKYASALAQATGASVRLDGGSANGYTHKQQVGWNGAGYALFAWIIDGKVCIIGMQVGSDNPGRAVGSLEPCSKSWLAGSELSGKISNWSSIFSDWPSGYQAPATAAAAGLTVTLTHPAVTQPNNNPYVPPAGGSGSGSGGGGNGGGNGGGGTTSFFTKYKTELTVGGVIVAVLAIGAAIYFGLKNR